METTHRGPRLGATVKAAREAKGWSLRRLAVEIGSTPSYVHQLEAGSFEKISPDYVNALAGALAIDRQDLFALAGYRVPEGLPSLPAYLRTKYGEDLPEVAIQRMAEYFEFERAKYATVSQPGQDDGASADHDNTSMTGGRS